MKFRDLIEKFRDKTYDPPIVKRPNLGTIQFTGGESYPVEEITLQGGCVVMRGTRLAEEFSQAADGYPFDVSVEGEYEVFDPSGRPVVLGWTRKYGPTTLAMDGDSFSVNVHIGPLGSTSGWFAERPKMS